MKNHSSEFSVERMAHVLEVSRSGYYEYLNRPENSSRIGRRMAFDAEVRAIFNGNRKCYGSEKIRRAFINRNQRHSRRRIADSMRRQGLRMKVRRPFKTTTDSKHSFPIAENILSRKFMVSGPDQVYVTDITYLKSCAGWLYLTVFLDLYSRMVVGWAVSSDLSAEGVLEALRRAVWRRKPGKGVLIHSDRGVQYCCGAFKEAVQYYGFVQSMSRKGNCWDNAVAESFWRTLKTELIYRIDLVDKKHAECVLFDYIEMFYNRKRLRSTLGYVSPAEFEALNIKKCA
jgi:transposase InsO family protein